MNLQPRDSTVPTAIFSALCVLSCGDGTSSSGAGSDGSTGSDPGAVGTGWQSAGGAGSGSDGAAGSGADGLTENSRDCPEGATGYTLPQSGVEYCLAASDACQNADAACPLLVTFNTNGAYFDRVSDSEPLLVAELHGPSDGQDVKDQYAELPRVLSRAYPGLDKARVFAVGWSTGAGAANRGLCHLSKKSDFSDYGSTSDVYAGVLALGGCGCANDYLQIEGNYHIFTFNGSDDIFNGGDSCEEGLRERAAVNECEDLDATWQPVRPGDPYAKNGDGSANAERLHFGECKKGEVVGYRGAGEGHVLSFKKNFDPKISGYDTAWNFIRGKMK